MSWLNGKLFSLKKEEGLPFNQLKRVSIIQRREAGPKCIQLSSTSGMGEYAAVVIGRHQIIAFGIE